MASLLQDLGLAIRVIRRRPGTSAVIVLTLALGIGVNTMFFSGLNGMVLRPLPFEAPERLVALNEAQPKLGQSRKSVAPANLRDWQDENRVFEGIAPYVRSSFNLFTEDDPERIRGASVSASLFPLIGVQPSLGRGFSAEEDRPGGSRVALISDAVWRRRFGSDRQVLGRTLMLDDRVHEIVGVMEPGFRFPLHAQVWTPLALDPADTRRDQRFLSALARLAPGVTVDEAQAAMTLIGERLASRFPDTNTGWSVRVRRLRDSWLPPVTQFSSIAQQVAVTFVLLIVCANVANLMLARLTSRRRETAVRAALGASRTRLIRGFLIESGVLALLAGALGTWFGVWGMVWLKRIVLVPIPYWLRFDLDPTALVFAVATTLLAGLLCGLVPAWRASGRDVGDALKAGGGRSVDAAGGNRLRNVLVVSQFAMSLMLLVGALLVTKSLLHLQAIDVGYETDRVLTMRLALTGEAYRDPERRVTFLEEALRRTADLTETEAVGASNYLPASRNGYTTASVEPEGQVVDRGEELLASYHTITDGYLRSLQIPVREGRGFTEEETLEGRRVALVSAGLAAKLWPHDGAVGRQLRLTRDEPGPWLRVVGVVGDIEPAFQFVGLDSWPRTQVYVPYGQDPAPQVTLALRARGAPALATRAVRDALRVADPSVPVFEVMTLDRVLDVVHWVPRLWSQQFMLFAAAALFVAVMGGYGVTAYSVSRRTREMGIRQALGARPQQVVHLVLGQGLVLAAVGAGLGLAGALPLAQLLASMLHGVSPRDPAVLGLVVMLLTGSAALASYVPARRAAKANPAVALRTE